MKESIFTADKMAMDATTDLYDLRRLRDYFVRVSGGHAPEENEVDEWWTLLLQLSLGFFGHSNQ